MSGLNRWSESMRFSRPCISHPQRKPRRMTSNSIFDAATHAVDEANSIVLITHVNPDGDAIGSMVGLANALRARGKIVDAVVDGGVPDYLRFLSGAETVM